MTELALIFAGGEMENGEFRPTIKIYFEHDGWSDAQFAEALRAGDNDGFIHKSERSLTLLALRVAVQVDEWEIGREVEFINGALKATSVVVWRSAGEKRGANTPSRCQMRRGTIEPYLDGQNARHRGLVTDMLVTARSQYPDLAQWMEKWNLTSITGSRGRKRDLDSIELERRKGDTDGEISRDLNVELQSVRARRLRDKQSSLGGVPWAIRPASVDDDSPRVCIPVDRGFQGDT